MECEMPVSSGGGAHERGRWPDGNLAGVPSLPGAGNSCAPHTGDDEPLPGRIRLLATVWALA